MDYRTTTVAGQKNPAAQTPMNDKSDLSSFYK